MIRALPESLRCLREPWFPPEVSAHLQGYIRFATSISDRDGVLHACRYVSGGAGTIIEERVDAQTYRELKELIAREYLPSEYSDEAGDELRAFLSARGVELALGKRRIPAEVYTTTREAYGILPAEHLGHGHFRRLVLGGWGHGAARCSEFDDPDVHMFTFAVTGPRRNFAALLLHETGHACFARMAETDKGIADKLHGCLRALRKRAPASMLDADTRVMPFAVDYLFGPASRVEEVITNVQEFAAEAYLRYVVRGVGLKDAIADMEPALAEPWRTAYEIFKESFGGVEYS